MIGCFCMPRRFFAILIFLIVLPACAQMKTGASPQTSVQEPMKSGTSSQASVQEPDSTKKLMKTGDYQKIIDAYKAEHVKHPQDQALLREYMKSLEEMNDAADGSFEREDYTSAGKIYNVLLKNYPAFKAFSHKLSFDRAKLNAKLTDCKTALSKKGFQEYRQGNLSEAIALWQGYLTIDPNNADIKKAVNTAKLQQKNLQQKQ
jgi:tetratricopeptide (TPR) repeat protein